MLADGSLLAGIAALVAAVFSGVTGMLSLFIHNRAKRIEHKTDGASERQAAAFEIMARESTALTAYIQGLNTPTPAHGKEDHQ